MKGLKKKYWFLLKTTRSWRFQGYLPNHSPSTETEWKTVYEKLYGINLKYE